MMPCVRVRRLRAGWSTTHQNCRDNDRVTECRPVEAIQILRIVRRSHRSLPQNRLIDPNPVTARRASSRGTLSVHVSPGASINLAGPRRLDGHFAMACAGLSFLILVGPIDSTVWHLIDCWLSLAAFEFPLANCS